MQEQRPVHRTIVVFDVEGFGNYRRTNRHQVIVRGGLYQSVSVAFEQAGIPWDPGAHEDRGDGIFVLIPPEVPKSLFVELLPSALVTALNAHNRTHPYEERIRLRMSLHAGEVHYDRYGVTGNSINRAFRLIDAQPLKAALAGSPGVLAIIASSWFFHEVVRHAPADVSAGYRPVLATTKEGTEPGWVCLPDHPRPAVVAAPDSSQREVPAAAASPYKGLRAFEKQDKDLFFGRETAVRELMDAVAASALVPVVGASGIGKSSLVHAGLLASLDQEKPGWGCETILPRPDLHRALAASLARLSGSAATVPLSELEAWQDYLSRHDLIGAAELACTNKQLEHALIVIDQFEEALTADDDPVLEQLAALPDRGVLTVVLTIRADSFGDFFVRDKSFGERLRRNAIALRGMKERELAEVIRRPAERHGIHVTDQLVAELTRVIRDRPGALPFLQFSLDQMWRTLQPGRWRLSSDEYHQIGGLDGALAAYADRVVNGLTEAEQAVVRNLFVSHLTSPEQPDVRQVVRRSECAPGYWPVIVRLADERLLTVGCDEDGHETAEVVHEALLRAWDQLRGWLAAERPFRSWRRFLRAAMVPWIETGDTGSLLTGTPLATSERWLAERAADLGLDERRFIEASVARRAQEENRYQMLYQRSLARDLTHRAELARDPVLALLLAIEVIERSPDEQADRLVRTCLNRLGAAEIQPAPRDAGAAAADRFRRRLTVAEWSRGPGPAGHWLLGDAANGLLVEGYGQAFYRAGSATVMPGPVVAAACTPAGVACLGTEPGELALWQLTGRGGHAEKLGDRDLGVSFSCLAVSDTAQAVAAACDDGVIRILDGKDKGLSEMTCLSFTGLVRDMDVSADRRIAALGYDRRIHVWDLVSQTLTCESVAGVGASRIFIAPGEDYVVTGEAGDAIGRFPMSAQALASWARRAAGRELTVSERDDLDLSA